MERKTPPPSPLSGAPHEDTNLPAGRTPGRERGVEGTSVQRPLAIVTGASGGIGRAITAALAAQGFRIVMACRNREKAETVRRRIAAESGNSGITVETLDLASFASIRAFAARIAGYGQPVSLLVNNAGAMFPDFGTTPDGFERTMATNCLGPVLLTELLLPSMKLPDTSEKRSTPEVATARIVNTVSLTAHFARLGKEFLRPSAAHYGRFRAYGRSKRALLAYTAELAGRTKGSGIVVNAADPGIVDTDIISMQCWYDPLADRLFRPLIRSPRRGAQAALNASAATVSGFIHYPGSRKKIPGRMARNPEPGTFAAFRESFLPQTCNTGPADKKRIEDKSL